jgi:hypothetical protein
MLAETRRFTAAACSRAAPSKARDLYACQYRRGQGSAHGLPGNTSSSAARSGEDREQESPRSPRLMKGPYRGSKDRCQAAWLLPVLSPGPRSGPGFYAQELAGRGAQVAVFDASAVMAGPARLPAALPRPCFTTESDRYKTQSTHRPFSITES